MHAQGGTVRVREYDPAWPKQFELERGSIFKVLRRDGVQIEHLAGTGVPGLASRPVVDLLLSVAAADAAGACRDKLLSMDYEPMPANGDGDQAFLHLQKSDLEVRTHTVRIAVEGTPGWRRPLQFRNFLLRNPDLAREYSMLKRSLAAGASVSEAAYENGKRAFFRRLEAMMDSE